MYQWQLKLGRSGKFNLDPSNIWLIPRLHVGGLAPNPKDFWDGEREVPKSRGDRNRKLEKSRCTGRKKKKEGIILFKESNMNCRK